VKKFIVCFLTLLFLCGCDQRSNVNYTYDIQSTTVDMSAYKGVSSTEHCFRQILPSEFFNVVDNKSSGVFVIGYNDCPYCQQLMKYLNEVGLDLGVTVYYMDAKNSKEPFVYEGDIYNRVLEIIWDYTDADDDGVKYIWTPTVFSIINGEVVGFQIGAPKKINGDSDWTYDNPSSSQIQHVKEIYEGILKPFVE